MSHLVQCEALFVISGLDFPDLKEEIDVGHAAPKEGPTNHGDDTLPEVEVKAFQLEIALRYINIGGRDQLGDLVVVSVVELGVSERLIAVADGREPLQPTKPPRYRLHVNQRTTKDK